MKSLRPFLLPAAARYPAVLLLVSLCAIGLAAAQGRPEKQDGFEKGPWVLTPSLFFGVEKDDNIFRQTEDFARSDNVFRTTATLDSVLYFSNSTFRFLYRADRLDYESTTDLRRRTSQDFEVQLDLQFSSGNNLTISNDYTLGIRDTVERSGTELQFVAQPFDFNLTSIEWSRLVPQRPGFLVRFEYETSEFDNDERVPFFDTDGWVARLEYRQPVSAYSWFTLGFVNRRIDNLDTNPDGVGGFENFSDRTEEAQQYLLGVRGRLGGGQQFFVQIGVEEYRLEEIATVETSSKFNGIVGRANLELAEFGRSNLTLNVQRSTFPSFLNTFYVRSQVGLTYRLPFLRYSSMTLSGIASRNQYGDEIEWLRDEGPLVRRDDRIFASLALSLRWAPRAGVRLSHTTQNRDSNSRSGKFDSTVTSLGIELGW
ncbi:hypothetical protein ABI59_04750 [Acidobacteria bacterium Mor1]|nr:hypothetical protein ABI59_04750 [Acidobacteria bacterium Mor1]